MSLTLYMDHHIPAAVTNALRQYGIDVLTALEDGHNSASDEAILARASQLGRVVYTHDADYLEIAVRWRREGKAFLGIVYTHQMKVTIGKAIDDLEIIVKVLEIDDMRDRIQFIPL